VAAEGESIRRRLSIFGDHSYRRLWGIGAVNSVMRWVEMVAVSVFVLELTGSVGDLVMVSFFRALPMLTFGVLFGAVADKVDRRLLLTSIMAMMALVYATLGVLVIAERIQLWHIMVGTFVLGVGWATDFPVRRNMVSEVVGRPGIAAAIGVDQATMNVARIIGPTVSGAFVQLIGVEAAYFSGAVLYAVAVVLAAGLAWKPRQRQQASVGPLKNISEGLRYVKSSDVLVPTLLVTVIVNVFVFPYTFVVPAIATNELHVGAVLLGVMTSFEGLGATMGSVLIATRAASRHYTRVYLFGSLVFAVMVLAFAGVPWYGLALPVVFVSGLAMSGFGAMQSIIVLNAVPAELRGRVLGVLTVCIGTGPFGALIVRWLAESYGPRTSIAVIGAVGLCLTGATALLWPRFAKLREIELVPGRPAAGTTA